METSPTKDHPPGLLTPRSKTVPGLPIFTLRLGAASGLRPSAPEVAALVAAYAPSFSLTPCDGYFRGTADPGWTISLAMDDHVAIAGIAEALRTHFGQDGVGIEAYGRYLRGHANLPTRDLIASMDDLAHRSAPTRASA
jgi:hypothetical protein